MIGLDYFVAGYLHLASAGNLCSRQSEPKITVASSDTKIRYDGSKSQAELDNFKYDTVSPYDKSLQTHVGGLMAGEVSVAQNIRIYQETYPRLNQGCLYIDAIKVDLHIKPVIYIASEYPKGSCMYNAVMEHEKKHIAVDRAIVGKYTGVITRGVRKALAKIGAAHGPFTQGQLKFEQEKLQTFVQDTIKQYSAQMSAERQKKQQDVDTLEEYERVQAKCRGRA